MSWSLIRHFLFETAKAKDGRCVDWWSCGLRLRGVRTAEEHGEVFCFCHRCTTTSLLLFPLDFAGMDPERESRTGPQHQPKWLYHCASTMEWPFCPNCSATLRADSMGAIECGVCSFSSHLSELDQLPASTSYSTARPTPLWAKSDEEQAALKQAKEPQRATIAEPCIKCGAKEVGFYTLQLRSVDEGSTVFYECPDCNHTWSVNN